MNFHWIEAFEGQRAVELHDLYSKEWWTKGRSFDDMMRMLKHSDLTLGCCTENGKLIGFARVLTDYTFKAFIFDVIAHESFRGLGVGQRIVKRIFDHETLNGVRSFELYCPDHIAPFYEKLGFTRSTSSLLVHRH
ncbi:GNAT family N-acetyltransferase [Phyllobacterium sp. SB3]|uniref:GNAT family N-acetyltransferase n=1 Tax=Phyllobacterium sp. SB3 TaxID=3156073 RepID=UPI0032AF8AB1